MSYRGAGERDMQPEEETKCLLRDEQGMALLITVVFVSLLIAVTLQFHKTTWHKYLVANNYSVEHQLKTIADSGVNIAEALLQVDGKENQFDSFLDSWATLDQLQFGGAFPTGLLKLQVVDLSGRLQVNSLVRTADGDADTPGPSTTNTDVQAALLNLLMSGFFAIEEEAEARAIVDSLIDWLDKDNLETDLGAENSYYQALANPYSCRNGPVRYIEELLLVKGIKPALLFGTGEKRGLADFLTVNGDDGRVNINTAPLLVIKSLVPLVGDDVLERFDEYRKEKANQDSLGDSGWYLNNGWPGDLALPDMLTTQSTYFKIIATGQLDTRKRSVVAVVERSPENEINLLGKKTE